MNDRMRDYVMDRRGRDRRDRDYEEYDRREWDMGHDMEYDERRYGGRGDRRMMDGRNPYGSRGGYVRDSRDSMYYDDRRDYRPYEHDYGGGYLSNKELRRWQEKLCKHLDKDECEVLEFENVISAAKDMNIDFSRYTEEELYTAVLMMYTDYRETVGMNLHTYVSLAKDFLCDKDAKVQYGEKLAIYHDAIVE